MVKDVFVVKLILFTLVVSLLGCWGWSCELHFKTNSPWSRHLVPMIPCWSKASPVNKMAVPVNTPCAFTNWALGWEKFEDTP